MKVCGRERVGDTLNLSEREHVCACVSWRVRETKIRSATTVLSFIIDPPPPSVLFSHLPFFLAVARKKVSWKGDTERERVCEREFAFGER